MNEALNEAKKAFNQDEVPIGAVLVRDGEIISRAFNSCEKDKTPLSHAEIKVINQVSQKDENWRLQNCELYVTLEPCPMCLGAIIQARINKVYFGCLDTKRHVDSFFRSIGSVDEILDNNHRLKIEGPVLENECSEILKKFFHSKR